MSVYASILAEPRDLLAWPSEPDASAQHRKLDLSCDGMGRVVFAGRPHDYEVIARFGSWQECAEAWRAARAVTDRLFKGENA